MPDEKDAAALPVLKKFLNSWFIAVVAGLLFAGAFPKTNIAGFAWVAPAVLVFAAHILRRPTGWKIFRVGYVGGIVFWLASLYWLLLMPAPGFSLLGWIALAAFVSLFPASWLCLMPPVTGRLSKSWFGRQIWALYGAAIWVALEMIRARIFGGFPWIFLGVSQFQMTPLIQIASVTGVYGISFLVVWTALSLFSAVRMIFENPKSRFAWQPEIVLPLFTVAGLFAYGEIKIAAQTPAASTLRVALVQPSFPQTLIWNENENSNRFQQLLQLSEKALTNEMGLPAETAARRVDLLLWPESAVPELSEANLAAITNLIRRHHVWLIFNADDVLPKSHPDKAGPYDVFNAAFLFAPDGEFAGVYHKQSLVIFGEYIPLEHSLPFIKWLTPIGGSYAAGNAPGQFELQIPKDELQTANSLFEVRNFTRVTVSPLICFEDTFPRVARRAAKNDMDFLVNLTNDGWFGESAEQWQHMANSVFRAVENGLPLVRCCNNGVSCWIDGNGRIRKIFDTDHGGVYSTGAMTIDLPISSHAQTFYNRHGDWFGWGCVGIAALSLCRKIPAWKWRRQNGAHKVTA